MSKPIPLGRADYKRKVAKEPRVVLRNRFFEQNPVLTEDPVALLARPGERYGMAIGTGPIRLTYTCPGTFNDDLFVVSGLFLYRVSRVDFSITTIGQIGETTTGSVSAAATANIGTTPGHLFIADGGVLWCYTEDGYAWASLTATGIISAGDGISLAGVYYRWTSGSVDAGSPDGSSGAPWLVNLGASAAESISNMLLAVNQTGAPGTDYSTPLVLNAEVTAYAATSDQLFVRARVGGSIGTGIAVTAAGANIAWNHTTLQHGGEPSLLQVPTPDDVGIISLVFISSFVILVPAQGSGINGRFFWIQPGETTIDPLDFATAERAPDAVFEVVVFSDQFWLCGQTTVEAWFLSGTPDAPFQRSKGVLFDRGTWEGTAIQVKDSLILVDADGGVFQIAGGVKRISTPDVSDRIREAIKIAAAS